MIQTETKTFDVKEQLLLGLAAGRSKGSEYDGVRGKKVKQIILNAIHDSLGVYNVDIVRLCYNVHICYDIYQG